MFNPDFSTFPILTTSRFVLREINDSDAPLIHELRSDPETNALIGRANSGGLHDAILHIERIKKNTRLNESVYWIICFQHSPSLTGTICLWNIDRAAHVAEIGYEVLPAFRGQGIMTEVLPAIIRFGFEQMKLKRINAFCSDRNETSIRLLKKNGFEIKSTTDDDKDQNEPGIISFVLLPPM